MSFSSGQKLNAAQLEEIVGAWDTYVPTWVTSGTQPAIGNGTLTGRYKLVGEAGSTVHFVAGFLAGSTTTFGTGQWNFGVPVAAAQPGSPLNERYVGNFLAYDSSAVLRYSGFAVLTSILDVAGYGINSSIGLVGGATATSPFTWATSDRFVINGTYETA